MTDAAAPDFGADKAPLLDEAVLGELIDLMGGDCEIVDDIVDTWLTEAPGLVEEIEVTRDPETLYNASHTLKSSSRSVGALRIGNLAEHIETTARAGDLADLAAARARDLLAATHEAIVAWRSARPGC